MVQFLLEKNNIRLDYHFKFIEFCQIEAGRKAHRLVKAFIRAIGDFLKQTYFYKGKPQL